MTLMRSQLLQAMIGDKQQRVGVRRKIDPHDVGLLVHDVIDEAGILMAEAVMVLAPDMRGEKIVQRGDRPPPRDLARRLQPFGVLVEHRIDDVDEGFVAVEQAVPTGQQIALEPALAGMLAEDLHHPPVRARDDRHQVDGLGVPGAVGRLEQRLQPVRGGLVRAEHAEIPVRWRSCASRRAGIRP